MKRLHILAAILLAATTISGTGQAATLIWTNSNGTFSTASNWSPAQAPAGGDNTSFTNDTTYTVSFSASTSQMHSNNFNGHAGTVTLNIGAGNSWTITNQQTGAGTGGFVVGQGAGTTATVQMISGSLNVTGLTAGAEIKIGGNGQGTFTVTNGTVRNNTTILGDTTNGVGTLMISGPNTVWTNGGQASTFDVGSISSGNSLTISNGAQLVVNAGSIGVTTSASSNTVLITGTNSIWNSTTINFGVDSVGNQMTIASGGKVITSSGTVGSSGPGANSNTLVVTGAGSVWSNSAGFVVGFDSANNSVIVTNGGQLVTNAGSLGSGAPASSNNLGIITGTNSIWSSAGSFTVGTSSLSNQLMILNGGQLISNLGTIGNNTTGSYNIVTISGPGSVWSNTGTFTLGNGGASFNTLNVSNGGAVYAGFLYDNSGGGCLSNSLNVGGLGASSSLTVTGNFQVGNNAAAAFGFLTITNATANTGTFNLGGGTSSNNTASVLAGTTWNLAGHRFAAAGVVETMTVNSAVITNVGDFIWGNNAGVNTLILTNGSQLFTGDNIANGVTNSASFIWDVGRLPGGSSNIVIVTGNGSTWDAGSRTVIIGDQVTNSPLNSLTVTAGGVFTNGSLLVGSNGASTNDVVAISGGKIAVSNLSMSASNTVTVSAGTLNTGGTTVSSLANNAAALVVGDGVDAASLELAAGGTGFHSFGSGLVITNNAALRGVGTIIGTTTILGTLSPGFSPGTITTSNNLTLISATINYVLGSNSDLTAVNGNLTLGGTLNVTDSGGFGTGTYTLFTYTGGLTYNGVTVGSTPNAGLYYAIDTGTVGQVNLDVSYTAPAGPITGSSSVASGASGVTYSISSVTDATTYTWTVPSGATIASGQGTTSITVNFGCSATSGTVTVTPSDGGGSGASSSLAVTVTGVGAAGSVSGSTVVCAGASGLTYSISSVSGATTYTWSVPFDATITSGQGGTSITVTWGSTSGNVSVTPANANGCTGTSSSLSVTATAAPGIASNPSPQTVCAGSTANFSVTASGAGLTYQWQKNGSNIGDGGTISGSGTTSLTLSNVTTGDSGASFDCVVSGTCSSPATSSGAILTVSPTSVGGTASATASSVCNGDSTTITLSGSLGVIQWQSSIDNATYANIGNATNTAVSTGPLVVSTYYRAVVISSPCSAATSTVAAVSISTNAPSVSAAPVSTNVCQNGAATFSVSASGNGPLSYMWRKRGTGWPSGWTLNAGGGGFFTDTSTDNDNFQPASNGGNDIDTSGRSWGLYNTGGNVTEALRPFPAALGVGQTFSMDMDNGASVVGTVGFGLQDSSSGSNRLEIYFVGGNGDYTINDANGEHDSGVPFTWAGINVLVRLTSSTTYAVTITRYIDGQSASFAGTLLNAGQVDQVRLFDANGAGGNPNNLFFNSVRVACADDNAADTAYNSGWNNGSNGGQVPLVNGGDIAGAGTATLTISPAALADGGLYDVCVDDACGLATISSAATLTVNSPPSCSVSPASAAICAGGSQLFTVNPSGGALPYTYLWSDGSTGASLTTNAAGTYSVTVTDSNGCTTTCSATLTVNPTPSCSVTPSSAAICAGGSQTFTVNPSGGTPGYTYLWSDGSTGSTLTTNAAGTYSVTVTDSNGCMTSCSATLTVNPVPTASAGSAQAICAGGSVQIGGSPTASGGSGSGYSYSWSPATGLSSATAANPAASPSSTTVYTVTVTDGNGCISAGSLVTVTVNPLPATPTAGNNGPIVEGNTLNLTASTMAGATYNWTGPNSFASANQNPSISNATSAASGTYSVTVTDSNGCTSAAGSTVALVTALRITAITAQGNDIHITWLTTGGTTNTVQVTSGAANGSYATNGFMDIVGSQTIVSGSGDTSTNYVDVGGATNTPSRYYRVRLVP